MLECQKIDIVPNLIGYPASNYNFTNDVYATLVNLKSYQIVYYFGSKNCIHLKSRMGIQSIYVRKISILQSQGNLQIYRSAKKDDIVH